MTERTPHHAHESNMQKDPGPWTTGDEPMTGAQRSDLKTLCEQAKVPFDGTLTKAQAAKRIDRLQKHTGRGRPGQGEEEGLTGPDPTGNPGSLGAAPGSSKVGSTPGGKPGA